MTIIHACLYIGQCKHTFIQLQVSHGFGFGVSLILFGD